MKKTLLLLGLLGLLALALTGCDSASSSTAPTAEDEAAQTAGAPAADIRIEEKLFLTHTNDIYLNADTYMGQTIQYEGMFFSSLNSDAGTDTPMSMVIRNGPGCCGDDGQVGFQVYWAGDMPEVPANNAWVEVVGRLEKYEKDGMWYLWLKVLNLREMPTRGQETVTM